MNIDIGKKLFDSFAEAEKVALSYIVPNSLNFSQKKPHTSGLVEIKVITF